MILTFEPVQNIGSGTNPGAIHTAENIVQVIYVGENGSIYAREASTPMGNWASLEFSPSYLICTDVDVEFMKLKYVDTSIFVAWKNDTIPGETVPYQPGIVHTLRHRFAVWAVRQNLSNYLVGGDIEFRLDDPVAKLSLEFENPSYLISNEEDSILTPGTSITLFFRSGDSARYIMGRYFVDRNSMAVGDATTSVEGRNAIGKLLKDQMFDDDDEYPLQTGYWLFNNILDDFGVLDYYVGELNDNIGMIFPPDMSGLDGILEVLKAFPTWKIEEDISGKIIIAAKNDPIFVQPATYTFFRNTDIFSRSIERDDMDAYSRVCVYNKDRTIEIYKNVQFRFVMGRKKTLHVAIAEGTTAADAETYATELASLLGSVGTIETFTGPFRPHLTVGDNATIIGRNTRLLGLITGIRHRFGKRGYTTEFTVDSGSVANRTRVSDYINKITGKGTTTDQATRLYE